MSTLYIESHAQDRSAVLSLVQSAINSEIARFELALKRAKQRLTPFEQKYGVTSKYFIAEMAAEDLEGGDEEYVIWAGEYQLMQRLQEKFHQLQEINYSDSSLLHAD
ncbi:hypothetical protein HYR99_37840 [Candidatus Poribacteria bacterium]|nr:hypothetical protein [Candidatus Poribacteria bacterium]